MLTDYCTSIAINIPFERVCDDFGMPIEVRDCGTANHDWNGASTRIEGDVFGYGAKSSLAYLIFDSLKSRGALWSQIMPQLSPAISRANTRLTSPNGNQASTSGHHHHAFSLTPSSSNSARSPQASSSSQPRPNHQQMASIPQQQHTSTRSTQPLVRGYTSRL